MACAGEIMIQKLDAGEFGHSHYTYELAKKLNEVIDALNLLLEVHPRESAKLLSESDPDAIRRQLDPNFIGKKRAD